MSDHEIASELLGVYSLDAVDLDDALFVELHVEHCDECRHELDQHFETAGALGTVVELAPVDLWSKIAQQLPAAVAGVEVGTVSDIRSAKSRRRAVSPGWFAAAAALVAVAVLGVSLINANEDLSRARSQALSATFASSWSAAEATPGHHNVTLSTSNGTTVGRVVVTPAGAAYLSSKRMSPLGRDLTYQLWVVSHSRAVSIGLMGSHPTQVSFAVGDLSAGDTLAVTVEPASGSVIPSSAPVASGAVLA
jgi:hypothetical protein